jgi:hypothetical protein|tara:strand:+ start:383 stop:604 length:222 start_codon:yes stop_codon:yes gene_type:complete
MATKPNKKKKKAPENSITSKTQFKDVDRTMEVMEQRAGVATKNGLPSTYTKIKLPSGTIKESYGERYGKPDNS